MRISESKTKKELKEEYKLKKLKIGVFAVRNLLNGKIYIGSSVNLEAMWNRIYLQLNFGNYFNSKLQKEWKEFGENNFRYEIISEIKQDDNDKDRNYGDEAKQLEKLYIDELQPFGEKGYN